MYLHKYDLRWSIWICCNCAIWCICLIRTSTRRELHLSCILMCVKVCTLVCLHGKEIWVQIFWGKSHGKTKGKKSYGHSPWIALGFHHVLNLRPATIQGTSHRLAERFDWFQAMKIKLDLQKKTRTWNQSNQSTRSKLKNSQFSHGLWENI